MNKVSTQKRQSRSNEAFFLNGYNTVQTNWRPQLPLPKEVNLSGTRSQSITNLYNEKLSEMDKHSNKSSSSLNTGTSSKKWSLGRLFRKKQKENETESSSDEQDRKAGFSPSQKLRKKDKRKRSSKLIGAGFDHIVISPKNENEFFVPFEQIELPTPPAEQFRASSCNSLDGKSSKKHSKKAVSGRSHTAQLNVQPNYFTSHQTQKPTYNSSSEEEIISVQSNKYRSDDSMGNGSGGQIGNTSNGHSGNGNGNRKSRSARTERYYKRMSRDGEISNGGILPHAQKYMQQVSPIATRSNRVYNESPNHILPNRERHKVLLHPEPQSINEPKVQIRQATSLNYVAYPTSLHLRHHNIAPGYKAAPIAQNAMHHQQFSQIPSKNLQNSITNDKRSISFDSHIHIPNRNLNLAMESRQMYQQEPPPPPPRDPQRRVHLNTSNNELRPMSFAFDHQNNANSVSKINGRCVSDDKLWGQNKNLYQNTQRPSSTQPANSVIYSSITSKQHTDQGGYTTKPVASRTPPPSMKSNTKPADFRYVTDSAPRSRKPIHILNQSFVSTQIPSQNLINEQNKIESPIRTTKSGLLPSTPSNIKTASNFWRELDRKEQYRQGREYENQHEIRLSKPRSVSSSRVNEMRAYRNATFEDILNGNKSQVDGIKPSSRENVQRSRYDQFRRRNHPAQNSSDEVDNIISGSLLIKPAQGRTSNLVEISNQTDMKPNDKSRSMPNYYQNRGKYANDNPINFIEMPKPNKYDEYVAKQREQNRILGYDQNFDFKNGRQPNNFPSDSNFKHDDPTNIEDVINELEAIYKSLNIVGESSSKRNQQPKVPILKDFEKYAKEFKDESSSEENAEPDIVKDDLALRNMKYSNDLIKTIDNQPPFGIPIGPVPPSPNTDYLHVQPEKDIKKHQPITHNCPDIITDDLAVRTLRKDSPSRSKSKFQYPYDALRKKQRATRTQSANIYALIQRDAAKPSGGDLADYYDIHNNLEKTGSLNDISRDIDEPPITLQLLKNLRNQEQQYQSANVLAPKRTVFRHPSQGGAICNLPTVLKCHEEKQKPPVPLPRSSISPDPIRNRSGMEEALNQIAKEAKESSEKLSRDLLELRKEALLSNGSKNVSSEKNLLDIEATSNDLKRCEEILLNVVPSEEIKKQDSHPLTRRLSKEEKYLNEIEKVSHKANEVRGKLLVGIEKSKPSSYIKSSSEIANRNIKPKAEEKTESPTKPNKISSNGNSNESLKISNLLDKLDPSPGKIDSITERCMRQITALDKSDIPPTKDLQKKNSQEDKDSEADYDNLNENLKQMTIAASQMTICKNQQNNTDLNNISTENILVPESNTMKLINNAKTHITQIEDSSKLESTDNDEEEEEIDKIMKECEKNAIIKGDNGSSNASSNAKIINTSNSSLDKNQRSINNVKKSLSTDDSSQHCYGSDDAVTTATGCTDGGIDQVEGIFITPLYSSSDCIKSSSPGSTNLQLSSSLTSAHNGGFSSSDYVKSPSSEYANQQSCTSDPIKTFSTTSYDCSTSSATPNLINLSSPICSSEYDNTTNNNSQIIETPSPPLNLTPIGNEVQIKSSSSKSIHKSNSIDSLGSNNNQSSQYNSSEELAAIFGITRSSSPITIESQISIKAPIATTEANNDFLFSDEYNTQGKNKLLTTKSSNAHHNYNSISKKKFQNNSQRLLYNEKQCSKCECIKSNQNIISDFKLHSNLHNSSMNEITNSKNNVFINDSLKLLLKTNIPKDNSNELCFACSTNHSKNHSIDNATNSLEKKISHNPYSMSQTRDSNKFSSNKEPNLKCKISNGIQSILNVIPESNNESSCSPSGSIDSYCNLASNSEQDYVSFSPRTNTYSSNVHIVLSEQNVDSNSTNQVTQFDSLTSLEEDNSSNPDSGNVSLSDFPVQQYINNNSSSFEVELQHNSKFNVSGNFVNEVKIPTPYECTDQTEINSRNIDEIDSVSDYVDLKTKDFNEISNNIECLLSTSKINDNTLSTSSTPDSFKSLDNTLDLSDDLNNFEISNNYNYNDDHNDIISIKVPLLKPLNQLKLFKPPEYDDDDFYTDDNQLSSIEEEDENMSECDIHIDNDNIIESDTEDLELKQFELLENHFRTSSSIDNLPIDLNKDSKIQKDPLLSCQTYEQYRIKNLLKDTDNIEKNDSNSNEWKLINQNRISLPSTSKDQTIVLPQNNSNSNSNNNDNNDTNKNNNNNNNNNDDENNDSNTIDHNNRRDELLFSDKLQLAHPDAARTTILEHMLIVCTYGLASNDVFTFFAIIVAVITLIALLLL
ncbi:protein PF3D7_1417600-like [Condylostylus longicornis]|uniref:protein PF3D7_1417600-like n=1 Tax=Condylostylus longicornis TaxID=2530218 RepID=UPI00244DF931|nr:protein PF3D7_1417600-like [Condylostylus longicornis]